MRINFFKLYRPSQIICWKWPLEIVVLFPVQSLWQSHVSVNLKLIHVHATQIFRTDEMACMGLSLCLYLVMVTVQSLMKSPGKKNSTYRNQKATYRIKPIDFCFVKGNFRLCQRLFCDISIGRDSGMSCRKLHCA